MCRTQKLNDTCSPNSAFASRAHRALSASLHRTFSTVSLCVPIVSTHYTTVWTRRGHDVDTRGHRSTRVFRAKTREQEGITGGGWGLRCPPRLEVDAGARARALSRWSGRSAVSSNARHSSRSGVSMALNNSSTYGRVGCPCPPCKGTLPLPPHDSQISADRRPVVLVCVCVWVWGGGGDGAG